MAIVVVLNKQVLLTENAKTWTEIRDNLNRNRHQYVQLAAQGNNDLANFAFANWHRLCAEVACSLIAPRLPTEANMRPYIDGLENVGNVMNLTHFTWSNHESTGLELALTVYATAVGPEGFPGLPDAPTIHQTRTLHAPVFVAGHTATIYQDSGDGAVSASSHTEISAPTLEGIASHPAFADYRHLLPSNSWLPGWRYRADNVRIIIRCRGVMETVPECSGLLFELSLYSPETLEMSSGPNVIAFSDLLSELRDDIYSQDQVEMMYAEVFSSEFAGAIRAGQGWKSAMFELKPYSGGGLNVIG